jgi:rhomboid protease GluP
MFLHYGLLHLALNMWAFLLTGRLTERLFGSWHFLALYLFSGLAGSVASVTWNPLVNSAGASGAIFGVFGALGVYLWYNRRAFGSAMLTQWVFWLIFNLAFTFGYGDISVSGHIGGLSMGLLLGLLAMPGFWTPVRVRLKRGQTGDAILFALKPVVGILVIGAALIALTLLFAGGR